MNGLGSERILVYLYVIFFRAVRTYAWFLCSVADVFLSTLQMKTNTPHQIDFALHVCTFLKP